MISSLQWICASLDLNHKKYIYIYIRIFVYVSYKRTKLYSVLEITHLYIVNKVRPLFCCCCSCCFRFRRRRRRQRQRRRRECAGLLVRPDDETDKMLCSFFAIALVVLLHKIVAYPAPVPDKKEWIACVCVCVRESKGIRVVYVQWVECALCDVVAFEHIFYIK